mmetsp:Transcript_32746/g.91709  ORF Transcript_32746/g.91709 Transcript_32746/m.91709 type:complete len:672 (+) Transcript_32746:342-2357(+)|eukprot:CAMPEP_0119122042 /NCGR_PEP_ID=MMETSP1310-20130426/2422_1 /TAXON_ID=464262 /ORGANISM="Genus nov. species nov., Strain RCC2339" /LENGTH=671 /DNA_ID=CAMNT_0007111647 /DNA_START=235 /DNA_END=2250 /DNA_ORIENTATION=+
MADDGVVEVEMEPLDQSSSNSGDEGVPRVGGSKKAVLKRQGTEIRFLETTLREHGSQRPAVAVCWQNLKYQVPEPTAGLHLPNHKPKLKTIIHDSTGYVRPGEMLAIMGPSGAGKTSLLQMLSYYLKPGRNGAVIEGKITIGGREMKGWAKNLLQVVPQHPQFFPSFTVRETLEFYGRLNSPMEVGNEEISHRARDLMEGLNLLHVEHTIIGETGDAGKLSGGEIRRVSIGSALMANPSVIILDEPLSGLDSSSAEMVIEILAAMARGGRAVAMIVHQPRSSIFHKMDKLFILHHGRDVYFGPAKNAVPYLESMGEKLPLQVNPADFVIDCLRHTRAKDEAEAQANKFWNHYNDTVRGAVEQEVADLLEVGAKQKDESKPKVDHVGDDKNIISKYGAPYWLQFLLLVRRCFLGDFRNPVHMATVVGSYALLGVLIAGIFYKIDDSQEGVNNRLGILFFVMLNVIFLVANLPELWFNDRRLIIQERAAKHYHPTAYFLAKIVTDIPWRMAGLMLYSVGIYFLVGFDPEVDKFFKFIAVGACAVLAAQGFVIILCCSAPSATEAQVGMNFWFVLSSTVAGFLVLFDSLPSWIVWLKAISFTRYAFEAYVVNEFEGLLFECDPSEQCCAFRTGEQVVEYLDYDFDRFGPNCGILLAMWIIQLCIAWVAYWYTVR